MIKDNGIRSNISKKITFLHLFFEKVFLVLLCCSLCNVFLQLLNSIHFVLFCFVFLYLFQIMMIITIVIDIYFIVGIASYIFEYCSFFIHWLNRMQINKSTHELWDKRKFLQCSRFFLFASIVWHEKTICERFKL